MLKQNYEIEKQEDEDLRCSICNYYYSSITKPYLLPCNHNLCSLCIDKIIKKKMLYCPLCRKTFSLEDREKFQVNFTFLHLVIKILKTKVIYCKKCSKIFNWTDHHLVCDQSQFKETNEIIEEIKTLIDDCIIFVKAKEQTVKLKENYLSDFFSSLLKFQKEIEEIFCSKTEKEIEQFYNNIPFLDIDLLYKELTNFVKICEPIYSSLNLNQTEINNVIENLDKEPQKNDENANEKYFNQQEENNKFGKQNVFNPYNNNDFITKDSDNIPTIRKQFITPLTINIQNTVNKGLPKEEERQYSSQDDLSTNINFDKLNYIISIYKKISDITLKILNHTRQIEFTSETIKSQISNNYTKFNSKIYSDLNSVHDTITVSNPNTQKNLFIHYIEINLSVIQCEKKDLAERLTTIIERYGVDPKLINLEITETASISARTILLENMKKLIEAGFSFSLDDFGKGESNLMYMVEMPVSIVKLDYDMSKAFFKSSKAKHVVRAVVNMAHGMDLKLVAEGIETEDEKNDMYREGIDYIQGFYYSKPLPMKEFMEFIQKNRLMVQ